MRHGGSFTNNAHKKAASAHLPSWLKPRNVVWAFSSVGTTSIGVLLSFVFADDGFLGKQKKSNKIK
jgi:hypothetical protein